jgi:hypothetical protein
MRLPKYEDDAVAVHGPSGPYVVGEYRITCVAVKPLTLVVDARMLRPGSSAREDGGVKRFPQDLAEALEPALRAARRVLDELDADDVPASLRRVVAHSGPRLTPPLARRLLGELDALEWLRADAAERLDGEASAASHAFLSRPDGWWAEVASALAELRSSAAGEEIEKLRRGVDRLQGDLVTLKNKMKQQKARAAAREAELREELKALRRDVASSDRRDERAHRTAEARIAAVTAELVEVRGDLADANHVRTELRSQLRSQRRELAAVRRALEAGGSASVPRDPVTLARELDLSAASVPRRHPTEPAVRDDAGSPSPVRTPLVVPRGIRPDRAEVVEWLLGVGGVAVIVDGYNLLFQLEPGEYTSGRSRRRLEALMAQFVRKSGGNAAVRIVFDSSLPGARDQHAREDGVVVVFAEADRLADEEVVHLAADTTGPVAVVTSDREVRENAALVGAAVVWSEAFAEWFAAV